VWKLTNRDADEYPGGHPTHALTIDVEDILAVSLGGLVAMRCATREKDESGTTMVSSSG
jgi:hypothetical protein